ncbi:glycosyltransferase family protein [Montanilutibacter psychrotolerans]|uniref:Glycosyltransferase n=1 Tax=Montanilutibacter psychrotolerans TaxID=1327343 RepID=A0A3M8SST7_9GAMM|nr:glycosyltransferase [Lysobacter psychrotolerans]RNF84359.1 glycosyltransferase [Lysobacter psychrotolerans]
MTANGHRDNDDLQVRLRLLRAQARLRELDAAIDEAQRGLRDAEAESRLVRDSLAFGLGHALLDACRSPRLLLTLPTRLAGLVSTWRARVDRPALPAAAPSTAPAVQVLHGETFRIEIEALNSVPDAPASLGGLRVAAVLDTFSSESLGPDCELMQLRPDDWAGQLRDFKPHLLLVESCWHGPDHAWEGLVSQCSDTLRSLVASCRKAGIPTAFWNKEDPLHFEAFFESAALFDTVFTTDADSIPRYKRDFGHARVYLMPFALQPKMFHPVAENAREDAFFFAGAYYASLIERSRDLRALTDALALVGPVHVFDRNHGQKVGNDLAYPAAYSAMVRGGMPYKGIADLYRSYRFGININTIKQSPTMFARRVFELIGSGCGVYSNRSLGISRLFGDLVVATDDQEEALCRAWGEFRGDDATLSRSRRVAALRKVLLQHTYAHRLGYLASRVGYSVSPPSLPRVAVLARIDDARQLDALLASCARQRLQPDQLLLAVPEALHAWVPDTAQVLSAQDLAAAVRGRLAGYWIAPFDPRDHYGEHYLQDLLLATRYTDAAAIGKAAYRRAGDDGLVTPELEYRRVDRLALRRLVIAADRQPGSIGGLIDAIDEGSLELPGAVSIDSLGYVEGGAMDDIEPEACFDEGVDMADALRFAESLAPAPSAAAGRELSGARLAAALKAGEVPAGTSVAVRRHRLELCAALPPGTEHATLRSAVLSRAEIERDGCVLACVDAAPDDAIEYGLEAVASDGATLARLPLMAQVSVSRVPPAGTAGYRFTVRLRGTLTRFVDGLWLDWRLPAPAFLPGAGRVLVVTNIYPEPGRPYRNGFVHRRVIEYRRRGVAVDVVCVAAGAQSRGYQYEGVPVLVCDPAALRETLVHARHDAIAVHFLDRDMWQGIRDAASRTRTVVWLHGAEIQPYARRSFNFSTDELRARAQRDSDARMGFWREILATPPAGLQLVFVSSTFAEQTWQDLGLRLPAERWQVIHNPIDTTLFAYHEKPVEARLNILSVRPHDTRVYANDLVADVIRKLSGYPEFAGMNFHLVGDGALFEQNFAGLDAFANVRIERRLLRQQEIADLHRHNGIFLVPTRSDTQGVSRDEAMASGLVPVTNLAGAVGDFVDERVAVLAGPEDVDAMVRGILKLIAEPQCFQQMSRAAARRVREQSDAGKVAVHELTVLGVHARLQI